MDTAEQIRLLSNEGAVEALSDVAANWLQSRTAEATSALFRSAVVSETSFSRLPNWVLDARTSMDDAGPVARSALLAILDGDDDEVRAWVRAAVRHTSEGVAHLLDPVSLGILGGILIGAILAARVKRIGKMEFYQGIPKELVDILSSAEKTLGGGDC
jgi:hypothetical protein